MKMSELTTEELLLIDGGANWYQVATGVAEVVGFGGILVAGTINAGLPYPGARAVSVGAVLTTADLGLSGVKNVWNGLRN